MQNTCLVGIDCGLTLVKAAAFRADGTKLAESARSMPVHGYTMDTEAMYGAVCACLREAASGYEVTAVGLSGHGNGLYALDESGEAVIAVSSIGAGRIPRVLDGERFYRIARQSWWDGQPMQLLRWLSETDPGLYRRIRTVLMCKDYIRYRLTGRILTDYSDASAAALLNEEKGDYDPELMELTGLKPDTTLFPPLMNGYAVAGQITREAAHLTGLREGTPVAAGLIDLTSCMVGAGALDGTRYSVTAGTWGISCLATDGPVNSRQITQNCFSVDRLHNMAVVSAPTSCVNLNWFLDRFRPGMSYEEANLAAAPFAPEEVGVIYLPFLYPDMAHPSLKAGFTGITAATSWEQMLRAVYEGVVFAHRRQIDRLRQAGLSAPGIRLSGGASNGMLWRRLFADIIRLPVEILREKQVGALGAAIMAASAIGQYPDVSSAVRSMVSVESVTMPCDTGSYEEKYNTFLRLAGENS